MDKNHSKVVWPSYATWWDRNEKKVNILLWAVFFVLLIVARELFIKGKVTLEIAVIWGALFIFDLFLLSFVSNSVEKSREN